MIWSLEILILLISTLLAIAFLTLIERKMLGYIHIRKGPNKVSFTGAPQPLADALKLFSKTFLIPLKSNFFSFFSGPFLALILSLIMWSNSFTFYMDSNYTFNILFFMVISSSSVYPLMLSGWGSNSWYATIGSYRAIAQTISYEVTLALILLSLSLILKTFKFSTSMASNLSWMSIPLLPLSSSWNMSILAETNRPPFDFAESESELVSGFNIEYAGGKFALLFLAEYGMIIFMSFMTAILLFQSTFLLPETLIISLIFLWIRGTSPRLRYDKLSLMAWNFYLPLALAIFSLCLWFSIQS